MFSILSFFLIAGIFANLYTIHSEFWRSYLNTSSKVLDGEEVFYRARNFESSFILSAVEGNLIEWYDYWRPVYGYYDELKGKCVQVDEEFNEFVQEIVKIYEKKIVMEAYQNHSSCLFFPVNSKGFKTLGILKSPLCINKSSPLSSC